MLWDWRTWARPEQLAPDGDWRTWLVLAGRGFGKTRALAEWIREQVYAGRKRIGLLAPTASDVRDVVTEGESGVLSVFPPSQRPRYEPSKRRISFHTGAIATTYSADEPERLRGPQHDALGIDELAAMRNGRDALDMAMLGLRLGPDPRAMIATTPKPSAVLRDVMNDPSTVVTRGSTYANRANLAPAFFEQVVSRYEGTRLGQQEIQGIVLDEYEGALFSRGLIEASRIKVGEEHFRFRKIVVGVDPAVSATDSSDFTGLSVVGLGGNGIAYVLHSEGVKLSPDGWAKRAIELYHGYEANQIVAEKNQGGDMVSSTLRTQDNRVPVKLVSATKGKRLRAEPVAALFEQGKAKLVGAFETLEEQMSTFLGEPGERSPDELDAMVWCMTELMLGPGGRRISSDMAQAGSEAAY